MTHLTLTVFAAAAKPWAPGGWFLGRFKEQHAREAYGGQKGNLRTLEDLRWAPQRVGLNGGEADLHPRSDASGAPQIYPTDESSKQPSDAGRAVEHRGL